MERSGGGYHDFWANVFCLTVPKKIIGRLLCFRNVPVWQKLMDKTEGITFIRQRLFVSESRKKSKGSPSLSQKNSGNENVHA